MVSPMDVGPDSDLIASITPDVMTCFRRSHFFERLDDLLCPTGDSGQREVCGEDYKISKRILEAAGFDSDDLKDMFAVLRAQGACCDCEVLYNVAESSRLKGEYWKGQADGTEANPKHGKDQCIMKERPASEGRGWLWGAASATLCGASLRYGG